MTMTAFIDNLVSTYSEYMDKETVHTPFPEKTFISKAKENITDAEATRYIDMGYQRLVGLLLWCSRNVFVECECVEVALSNKREEL